jgi:acetyl-CoA decarbonylase/synthase complex subunit gamma
MNFRIDPGIYALGQPDKQSPVLVTANYKMSFDRLRSELPELSAWILVLDTNGINVWCAAGKGMFGTDELVNRVKVSRLEELVEHRTLIVPQLGAPGVAAHLVRQQTGFRVVYGPIEAEDIPKFLEDGNKASAEMRKKTFMFKERLVLIPVELVECIKYGLPIAFALFFLAGLGWTGGYWETTAAHGPMVFAALIGAIVAGVVITPLLLPWLPGRTFSLRGFLPGLALGAIYAAVWWPPVHTLAVWLELGGLLLFMLGFSAFLAMNFTGASTFTSLSGVKREMRIALPLEIAGVAIGLIAWIVSRFV